MKHDSLLIRNVAVEGGARADLAIVDGRVAEMPAPDCIEIDGNGMTAIPGLIDHHIHLLATAALAHSVDLSGMTSEVQIIAALRASSGVKVARAVGYDERAAGLPDAAMLDRWLPGRALRVQDRTGALWVLSTELLDRLGPGPWPDCVERDTADRPTGRVWRGDAWLRERIGGEVPDLGALACDLARFGIIGVTDAGPNNGPQEAALFERAMSDGVWPLRLQLMGNEQLPAMTHALQGPLKLHFDERDLPPLDDLAARIAIARNQQRSVATHCVTLSELVWLLEALDRAGGGRVGDRIEHGGVIPEYLLADIARHRLTLVTNPAFIWSRGDRYCATIATAEHCELYRLGSAKRLGIRVAAGSDAPYGPIDPWLAIRTARDRTTRDGQRLGTGEAIDAASALALYLDDFTLHQRRRLTIGSAADLCLIRGDWRDLLNEPDAGRLVMTVVAGQIIWSA